MRYWKALTYAAALLAPLATHAQQPPPPGAVAPVLGAGGPLTLAGALAKAEVPHDTVYLAVGAEKTTMPTDTDPAPLPPGASLAQVADAYGRLIQAWETAGAIAPPTMTILNTDPGNPNPYAGMPPTDAFKLLLGSLDDGQWQRLTGTTGLSKADLTDDSQRGLFAALFPGDTLTLSAQRGFGDYGGGNGAGPAPKLSADDLAGARLRLAQRVQLGIPVIGKSEWLDAPAEPSAGQTLYDANGGPDGSPSDTLYGVKIRDTVPTTLKPADLDWDMAALQMTVSLAGVKTVGDLVTRLGLATHIELYADRRYEKRTVTIIGPASARACDLLRALALCVCGTYRRVGPAFVLTDDVLGLGARRIILQRFAGEADLARHAAVTDAGDKLMTVRGGPDALPSLGGDLGFSEAQKAQAAKTGGYPNGQGIQVQAPVDQLTPQQQAAVRRQFGEYNSHQTANQPNPQEQLTLNTPVLVMAQPTILLLTPAAPGPVTLDNYIRPYELFQPSQKLQQEMWQKKQDAQAKAPPAVTPAAAAPPPPPPLASLLRPFPRRAVFAHPHTASEVDALVASMHKIGLNQLWLDVFSQGKSHLDGTPDILTEALAKTRGTGIAVVPTLDLLDWGADAPEDAQDRTMLGETSAQAKTHRQRYEDIMYQGLSPEEAAKQPPPADLSVSPAAAMVSGTLTALVQRLAGTPGVAGVALTDTATPGYDRPATSHYGVQGDPLGYTLALRLAFLRRTHVDPIDLEPESYEGQMNADTSLPEFEDWGDMQDVPGQWNALRNDTDLALMRGLLGAAQETAGRRRFPVWVRQRRTTYQGDWWGLWTDPRTPLPELPEDAAYGGSGPDTNYAAIARTQSRLNIFDLPSWAGGSVESLTSGLQQMKPGWDGFLLDFGGQNDGGPGTGDPLAELASTKAAGPAKP